jgi:Calx-beta domain
VPRDGDHVRAVDSPTLTLNGISVSPTSPWLDAQAAAQALRALPGLHVLGPKFNGRDGRDALKGSAVEDALSQRRTPEDEDLAAIATAVTEGSTASVTISLANAAIVPITVSYATQDDTAANGVQYTATSGQMAFQPGQTSQAVTVSTIHDNMYFPNSEFLLTITSANAPIAVGSAKGRKHNHQLCRDVMGMKSSLIALNKRGTGRKWPKSKYRRQMKHSRNHDGYGQRWQVEIAISRNKRLLGSALRSRSSEAQARECLLRDLTHNLMILR